MRPARWCIAALLVLSWAAAAGAQVSGAQGSSGQAVCTSLEPALESRVADADTLLVLLHAYDSDPERLYAVRDALRESPRYASADFFIPELPFALLSMARAQDVLADLLQRIDCIWQARDRRDQPYETVVLLGHSMGALYARKLYVLATGENADAPFEVALKQVVRDAGAAPLSEPRHWASKVERIVLLAGMNRGWSISHQMSLPRAVIMTVGVAAGRLLSTIRGREPLIFGIRRGAPFITQLRLQWLSMREHAGEKGMGAALTVQLLGTVDDLVSPQDNIDLVTGRDFVYLEVPHSGHADVVQMHDPTRGAARREVLHAAATLSEGALLAHSAATRLALGPDGLPALRCEDVRQVVFVIHGIRDEGFWTQRIAQRLFARALAARGDQIADLNCPPIATVTSSYGYFPMLSFLWPRARQEKVEWLMDQYTQARAMYPGARFSFVGHSHGTYLLARALRDYDAVEFERVVFAGSVVERDYDWDALLRSGRVQQIVNFRASADWVVAFFPKTLEMLGLQDLGAAGHDGFRITQRSAGLEQPHERIVGGHGAALQEQMWDAIANFVLSGELELPGSVSTSPSAVWWVKFPAYAAPLVWVLIACVLVLVLRWLWRLELAEWQRTLALVGYGWLLWMVVTKV